MEYTLKNLAEKIQDKINFEECEEEKIDVSDTLYFDDVCVDFMGHAKGYANNSAESILNEIYIESASICSLTTGCEIDDLDVWQLNELEKLITW